MRLGGDAVEAFEPAPPSVRSLTATVKRNRLARVRIHELALSNENGSQTMRLDDRTVGSWSMTHLLTGRVEAAKADSESDRLARDIQVETRTLDQKGSICNFLWTPTE